MVVWIFILFCNYLCTSLFNSFTECVENAAIFAYTHILCDTYTSEIRPFNIVFNDINTFDFAYKMIWNCNQLNYISVVQPSSIHNYTTTTHLGSFHHDPYIHHNYTLFIIPHTIFFVAFFIIILLLLLLQLFSLQLSCSLYFFLFIIFLAGQFFSHFSRSFILSLALTASAQSTHTRGHNFSRRLLTIAAPRNFHSPFYALYSLYMRWLIAKTTQN